MKNFKDSNSQEPNSYKQILEVLKDNVLMTENEIYIAAFG